MTLETFFDKFDQFADAPDAVVRMRELVLNFAVQGKLVERRASEHDGHSLLKKLRKLPLEENSKSRSRKDIAVEPETQLEIPHHWALTTVENTTRQTGFFCDGDWVESKDQDPNGKVRLIQLADVGDGHYRNRSSRFMTKEAAKRLNCSYLEPGDILVARMPDPLGRCCRFPGDAKPSVTVVDVCILRPNVDYFDPDFLVVALNCPRFRRLVAAQATGTTRSRISRSNLAVLPIPLPPLAEQKRIVAKVDELMALCDRLEAQQQERDTRRSALARASLARFAEAPTPANLHHLFHPSYTIPPADLRKSILTLAVQGKLVPQDPNDEPIAQPPPLRLSKAGSSGTERDAPFQAPNGWIWAQLGQVSELINGDRSKNYPNKAEYVSKGVAWINTGHIEPDGTLSIESMHYITREKFDSLRSGKVSPGDLVYCLRGATLGKTAIITQFDEGAVASSLVIIRLSPTVDPNFAHRFLTGPLGRQQIFQFDNGSAQPNLSANNVKRYWVPLPPLAEQRRIVAKVDQLMALVDELETQLAASRATAKNLLQALVAELTAPNLPA